MQRAYMIRRYSDDAVRSFVEDYEHDFGVQVSLDDACRVLVLFDAFHDLLVKYDEGLAGDVPPYQILADLLNR